ncbi:serine/threonine-protein kinase [Maioricimonas rarisocia]|nr:serine/threonine-protein kinase [Maioricimonas rarisocia]
MTVAELAQQLEATGLLSSAELTDARQRISSSATDSGESLAKQLVRDGKLTRFQAQLAYGGKAKSLVLGSYVVLDKLGEGGMGQVYKARHRHMKREVAIKLLARQHVKSKMARQRFLREVEAAARLTHPNIVAAFDASEHRGTYFLVMEYVQGQDLKSLVETSGPLQPTQAVKCLLQAARGLAFAHSQNVVHRDIKPSNLLLDEEGTVKVLDMGLARFEDNVDEAGGLTGTGMVMGTVDYMAPEQGMDARTADQRADIYSLGCTLYYLLTGRAVFEEDTVLKRIMAHQTHPIPRLPVDDAVLQSLFERLLAKKVEDRVQTANELISELEQWQQQQSQGGSLPAVTPGRSETSSSLNLAEGAAGAPVAAKRKAKQAKPDAPYQQTVDMVDTGGGMTAETITSPTEEADLPLIVADDPVSNRLHRKSRPALAGSEGLLAGRRKTLFWSGGGGIILLGAMFFAFSGPDDSGEAPPDQQAAATTDAANDDALAKADISGDAPEWPDFEQHQQLSPLGSWSPAPLPPYTGGRPLKITGGHPLPGILEQQTTQHEAAPRWNVDTFWPRGRVTVARYSPDGKWLALGSDEGHVRLYDSATPTKCVLLPGLTQIIGDIAWHPDSRRIAVAKQGSVRVWDIDGNCLLEITQAIDSRTVDWIDDGSTLAIGSEFPDHQGNEFLTLFDEQGEKIGALPGDRDLGVLQGNIAWSPDSTQCAAIHTDGAVRVWQLSEGTSEVLTQLDPEAGKPLCSIAWSSADWIAVAAGKEILFFGPDRTLQQTMPFAGAAGLRWDRSGTRLVAGTSSLRVWDVTEGKRVAPTDVDWVPEFKDSGSSGWSIAHEWAPDGSHIVRAGGQLDVFDPELTQKLSASPRYLRRTHRTRWSPDGARLLTISWRGPARVWSATGQLLQKTATECTEGCWSSDSSRWYAVVPEGLVEMRTSGPAWTLTQKPYEAVAVSPDGMLLAGTVADSSKPRTIDILSAQGTIVRHISLPGEYTDVALDWSAASNRLLVDHGGEYHIIEPDQGWKVTSLPGSRGNANAFWTPDGTMITDPGYQILHTDGTVETTPLPYLAAWRPSGKEAMGAIGNISIYDRKGNALRQRDSNLAHFDPRMADWNPEQPLLGQHNYVSLVSAMHADSLEPYWTAVLLPDGRHVSFSAAGEILDGDAGAIEEWLVYYVATEENRVETLRPSEFFQRIGEPFDLTKPETPVEPTEVPMPDAEQAAASPNAFKVTLAPEEQRLRMRDPRLPRFQSDVKPRRPLGAFAAVPAPDPVNGVISWSIEPRQHRSSVRCIDVNRDGIIATGGSRDCAIRLWTPEGELLKVLTGHQSDVVSVQFSPNGKTLASVCPGPGDYIALWDVASGQLLRTIDVRNWHGRLRWSPQGDRLLHCGSDTLEVSDPRTGRQLAASEPIRLAPEAAWSPDGKQIFVASAQSGVGWVLEAATLTIERQLQVPTLVYGLDWSPDGRWIALANEKDATIWDTRSFAVRHRLEVPAFCVQFSRDGSRLAVGGKELVIYDTDDWSRVQESENWSGSHGGLSDVAWTPDDDRIFTTYYGLDVASGETIRLPFQRRFTQIALASSGDGKQIATGTQQQLKIWEAETGRLTASYPIVGGQHYPLMWQPGGNLLLRIDNRPESGNHQLTLIDARTGEIVHHFAGHPNSGHTAGCWAPDGSRFATIGEDGVCRLWDPQTGEKLQELVHDDALWYLTWSHDGKRIACGTVYSEIAVWDVEAERLLHTFDQLAANFNPPAGWNVLTAGAPFTFLRDTNELMIMHDQSFEVGNVRTGEIRSLGQKLAVDATGVERQGGNRLTLGFSPDFSHFGLYGGDQDYHLFEPGQKLGRALRWFVTPLWLDDSRRLVGGDDHYGYVRGYDLRTHRFLGTLLPQLPDGHWAVLGRDGSCTGSEGVEEHLVVVALLRDGSINTYSLDEFADRFRWKNDPDSVRFLGTGR